MAVAEAIVASTRRRLISGARQFSNASIRAVDKRRLWKAKAMRYVSIVA